uniref:Protein lin-9 homolog n=1 Tax=Phallusia mammillata TaxID=59560 RepID=A0A6F9DJX0_9ASCI|nr:protein lin-9 homolog [Phallusia mammillata]
MTEQVLEDSSVQALINMKHSGVSMMSSSPNRPQRTRRRNRLIYNDDEVTTDERTKHHRKVLRQTNVPHVSSSVSSPVSISSIPSPLPDSSVGNSQNAEKAVARKVGGRLRNLLKLPKAHKMCMYEWFYSHLDSALFNGDNDFCLCLKESFPHLKTARLTRAHWSKIRRLMGKPRRCSPAFFEEERAALAAKRNKIRLLQQRKIAHDDSESWSDLPKELPMPLVIGTKVTARLRGSHDGLFTGQIDAVDLPNSSYRVTFDRSNLGTHTVCDIEVASCEPQETINLLSLMDRKRHLPFNKLHPGFSAVDHDVSFQSPSTEHDPVLGRSPLRSKFLTSTTEDGGTLGGFPVQLLKRVARLSRVLAVKREKIQKLGEMNSQAEKLNSYGETLNLEFQRKYATVVLDLERLNKGLNELLVGVQRFCLELYPEQTLPSDQSTQLRQQCLETAENLLAAKNVGDEDSGIGIKRPVKNVGLTDLITQLTSLMLQVKYLKESKGNCIEFKSLSDAMRVIKTKLSTENAECFQNNVEIHIAHIRSGMEHSLLSNYEVTSESSEG